MAFLFYSNHDYIKFLCIYSHLFDIKKIYFEKLNLKNKNNKTRFLQIVFPIHIIVKNSEISLKIIIFIKIQVSLIQHTNKNKRYLVFYL